MPILEHRFKQKLQNLKPALDVHQFARENLEALYFDYIPGIPDQIIHSDSLGATHKAQKTWFTMVVLTLDIPYIQELISVAPNIRRESGKFKRYYTGGRYEKRDTVAKDIKRADRLLRRVMMIFDEWESELPIDTSEGRELRRIDNLVA